MRFCTASGQLCTNPSGLFAIKLEEVSVQKLVHSFAVDTATHRLYAPEHEEDGKPVARIVIYEPAVSPKK